MLEFIFTLILMVSLGFVLYLMVIALPRVAEEPDANPSKSIFERWAHSHMPEKIDAALDVFFLKVLRKTKVLVLRMDNALGKHLKNIKIDDDAKKPIDFSDITAPKDEDKKVK